MASSPAFSAYLIVPLAALYFACFHPYTSFTDIAYFGGDTWEYQAMSVNFANGHGLNRFGGVEPFEAYQFGEMEWNKEFAGIDEKTYADRRSIFMNAGKNGGDLDTNRMPLYMIATGTVYALFGVHPLLIKNIQLLLLCLVAGGLPLLGSLWWKKKGLLAGLLAGAPFVGSTMLFANVIMVETLTVFVLYLCILGVAFYQEHHTARRALLVGALLGLCLLTKLSLILLPFIVLVLLWWQQKNNWRHILLMGLTCTACLVPWSIYTSAQVHFFVLFSTESMYDGLLDAHNEYTVANGLWHPEWRDLPDSFYRNDGMADRPDFLRIAHFYLVHPNRIARLPLSKLVAAVTPVPSAVLLVMLLAVQGLLGSLLRRPFFRIISLLLVLMEWWMLTLNNTLRITLQPLVNNDGIWPLLAGFTALCALLLRRFLLPDFSRFPLMATAVILNFFCITILVMSDDAVYQSRHVKVADFLLIILVTYVILEWIAPLCRLSPQKKHD